MPVGARYFDELRMQLIPLARSTHKPTRHELARDAFGNINIRPNTQAHAVIAAQNQLALLDDPNTKRLIFDARQASMFDSLIAEGAGPADELRRAVHLPFDQFYLEFSEPILLNENEPEHEDYARAMLIQSDAAAIRMRLSDETRRTLGAPDDLEYWEVNAIRVVMFLKETMPGRTPAYVDRSFLMSISDGGLVFAPAGALRNEPDASDLPPVRDPRTLEQRSYDDFEYVICALDNNGSDRHIGWFERAVASYGDLLMYILAYTNAKSTRIVEAPLTRQERRWNERRGMPNMWHIIDVDPKFYRRGDDEETGRHHSYRYDVIGHFRVGNYKRGDGSRSHIISWIPPHQRGLAHSLYIPATHNVRGGKTIAPIMRKVYGQEVPTTE